MRIGVFDSGLGGLSIARAIALRLPEYDLMYLGDTKRVPYGGRSQEAIHGFVAEALTYLFENDCGLVVLACNTASAEALRRSQQEYLPRHYPDRNVLGVVIPTAEAVAATGARRVGVLATRSTAASGAYEREIKRQAPDAEVRVLPAPLLVPLVENDGLKYVDPVLDDYLADLGAPLPRVVRPGGGVGGGGITPPLQVARLGEGAGGRDSGDGSPWKEERLEGGTVGEGVLKGEERAEGGSDSGWKTVGERVRSIDCLVLGCTHYDLLKDLIRAKTSIPVIAQDEVVPEKLADYLRRHPEHDERLGRTGERIYRVTDLGPGYQALARTFAGEDLHLEKVDL